MKFGKMDSRGASLVEYAMLASLVATVAIASVAATGQRVGGVFSTSVAAISGAEGGSDTSDGPASLDSYDHYWTFRAGEVSASQTRDGYRSSSSTAEMISTGTNSAELVYLYDDQDDSEVVFIIMGDHVAEVLAGQLTCSDGLKLAGADAWTVHYYSEVTTRAYWDTTAGNFIPGEEYTCAITPVG
jgi:Flp pilus assembly pilin Flp